MFNRNVIIIFILLSIQLFSITSFKCNKRTVSMKGFSIDSIKNVIKTKAIPAIIGSSIILSNPMDTFALQSGSRSGGSSFRSSGSTRSYSSSPSRSSYSSSPSIGFGYSPFPVFTPMFSPFTPFYYSSPLSGVTNLILTVGTIYVLARVGGAFFSGNGLLGAGNEGATVIKLQLAVDSSWESDGIIRSLTSIAARNSNLNDRSDLANLLSETSLALLRRQNDWYAVSHEVQSFNDEDSNTESAFQRLAIKERTKFEKENQASFASIKNSNKVGGSTVAVVSLIVALRGKNSNYKSVRNFVETRNCLEALAGDALVNDGENVLAVEVLWTPDEPNVVLTEREVIENYPELLKF